MDDFIERLRVRLTEPEKVIGREGEVPAKIFPPATEEQLDAAESALGFALPGILRSVYSQVANGGIGPSFGLLGIAGGATDDQESSSIGLYQNFLSFNESDDRHQLDEDDTEYT